MSEPSVIKKLANLSLEMQHDFGDSFYSITLSKRVYEQFCSELLDGLRYADRRQLKVKVVSKELKLRVGGKEICVFSE